MLCNFRWGEIVHGAVIRGDQSSSGTIIPGAIIQREIVWGAIFIGGNYPLAQLSGEQLSGRQFSSGTIVLEPNYPNVHIHNFGVLFEGAFTM